MPLSDKSSHLNSDEHKNKTKQQHIWCEDSGKYISNSRHFQSEIQTLRSQNNRESYREATKISQDARSVPAFAFSTQSGVEIIVN